MKTALALTDLAPPIKEVREEISTPVEKLILQGGVPSTQPVIEKKDKIVPMIPSAVTGKNPWSDLKIKLNHFKTFAPMVAMAISDGKNESSSEIVRKIGVVSSFHKNVSMIIAKELWPSDNVPAAALAVIGKSAAETVSKVWEHNKVATDNKISADQVAEIYLGSLPNFDHPIEDIFSQKDQISLPVLVEASVGANIQAKLTAKLNTYSDPIKELFLGKGNDISDATLFMTKDILAKSREIAKTVTTHCNIDSSSVVHTDAAYQSTLETIKTLYESNIDSAVREISNDLCRLKGESKEVQNKYLAILEKHDQGQLYTNVTSRVENSLAIVYTQKKATAQSNLGDKNTMVSEQENDTDYSPSPR